MTVKYFRKNKKKNPQVLEVKIKSQGMPIIE